MGAINGIRLWGWFRQNKKRGVPAERPYHDHGELTMGTLFKSPSTMRR